jgi:hypothetical protein
MPRKTDTAVVSTIGIDTGKNALHMVGLDERGAIVLREKVSRLRIAARLVNVQPCLIGIEAGMARHYLARELVALGHEVNKSRRLMRSRFDRATRTTSETPTRLRKPFHALRHVAYR